MLYNSNWNAVVGCVPYTVWNWLTRDKTTFFFCILSLIYHDDASLRILYLVLYVRAAAHYYSVCARATHECSFIVVHLYVCVRAGGGCAYSDNIYIF